MKFASEEIRSKAVKAYLDGKATTEEVANILGYTPQTIRNWIRTYKRENRLAPKPNGHRKSCFSEEELGQLTILIEKHGDMTLEEIRSHFGKTCTLTALNRIIHKLGFRYKKNSQSQRTRTRGCKATARWMGCFATIGQSQPIDFSRWNWRKNKYDEALRAIKKWKAMLWFRSGRTVGARNIAFGNATYRRNI